mmetsp:Transcript_52688/g.114944  ORF Transcript_52688/g.114944 Transcript_52688/m.114944 type:complete len:181 (+) Transcript_52688:121-663(+)|eukprot:1976525-Pleurochrysis_carterae.AAC.2
MAQSTPFSCRMLLLLGLFHLRSALQLMHTFASFTTRVRGSPRSPCIHAKEDPAEKFKAAKDYLKTKQAAEAMKAAKEGTQVDPATAAKMADAAAAVVAAKEGPQQYAAQTYLSIRQKQKAAEEYLKTRGKRQASSTTEAAQTDDSQSTEAVSSDDNDDDLYSLDGLDEDDIALLREAGLK